MFWAGRDLPELLERWSAHVPPERVHVVPMPASRTSTPTLLERFCAAVGVPATELTEPDEPVNAAIGRAQTDLLRLVNEVAPPEQRRRGAHGARSPWHVRLSWLGLRHLGSQDGDSLKMPAQWREWCEEVAQADIDFLRTSGVQVHGDLEDLRPRASDFSDAPAPSSEQLLRVATQALSDIVAERAVERLPRAATARAAAAAAQQPALPAPVLEGLPGPAGRAPAAAPLSGVAQACGSTVGSIADSGSGGRSRVCSYGVSWPMRRTWRSSPVNGVGQEDADEAGHLLQGVHPAADRDDVGVVVLAGEHARSPPTTPARRGCRAPCWPRSARRCPSRR